MAAIGQDDMQYALRVSDVGKRFRARPDHGPDSRGPKGLFGRGGTGMAASKEGFGLKDVTLDLPLGYIMGLIGPNGAGKSTLIKLILNMIRRDSGDILVMGRDNIQEEEAIKGDLGVVFDSIFLKGQWYVEAAERVMAPFYPRWNSRCYAEYLQRFGLQPGQKIKKLSRGMQMKLMLAIALSHDARLLILDEPTSGLDVLTRDELMDILVDYIADGRHSVLFSTHITADLESVADFITYINAGSVYFTGPKDEFEDSFMLVQGAPGDISRAQESILLGLHAYATGFDALIRSEDRQTFLEAADPAHSGACEGRYQMQRADFDTVMRLTVHGSRKFGSAPESHNVDGGTASSRVKSGASLSVRNSQKGGKR